MSNVAFEISLPWTSYNKDTNVYKGRLEKVHHITIVKEPGGSYVTHFVPPGENGLQQAAGLDKVLDDTDSKNTLIGIGCGKLHFIVLSI